MGNRIISISRQFGSGGHEVAVKTADLLGIRVYEKELIRLACEYGELSEKTLSPSDEKATNPYLFQTVHEGNYHVLRGKPTSEVIQKVLNKVTLFGAVYLGIIACVPIIISACSKAAADTGISLGGTSIIIVVGVAIETVQALESQMLMRHYKGFLE